LNDAGGKSQVGGWNLVGIWLWSLKENKLETEGKLVRYLKTISGKCGHEVEGNWWAVVKRIWWSHGRILEKLQREERDWLEFRSIENSTEFYRIHKHA
jgi:hypothetical protein